MFVHQGIYLPDGEQHFASWMSKHGEIVDGRGTYQIKKHREAMKHCKQFRRAIDVGAHVGLHSLQMAKRFNNIYMFEPVAQFRECLEKNMAGIESAELYECALGAAPGRVAMHIPKMGPGIDSGGTHVKGAGDIEMRTLDSFKFLHVDYLKIDCEGYELEVLKGAEAMLRENKPCVMVEQKAHKLGPNFGIKGTPAVDFLRAMGATLRREMGGDYILSW